VMVALIVPNIVASQKEKQRKKRKAQAQERGENVARTQTDYESI
jgi:putative ABC transport system permease protein